MTRLERDFLHTLQSLPHSDGAVKMASVRESLTQWLSLPDFKQTMDDLEEKGFFERVKENETHYLYPDNAAIAYALDPPVPSITTPGARSRCSSLAERLAVSRACA